MGSSEPIFLPILCIATHQKMIKIHFLPYPFPDQVFDPRNGNIYKHIPSNHRDKLYINNILLYPGGFIINNIDYPMEYISVRLVITIVSPYHIHIFKPDAFIIILTFRCTRA